MPGDRLREAVMALPTWDKRSVPGGIHVKRADVLAAIEEEAAALDVDRLADALRAIGDRYPITGNDPTEEDLGNETWWEHGRLAARIALEYAARDRVGTEEPGP